MSAATMAATADKNLALILEMGGDPQAGYDPIPPAQYLCFLDKNLRITPSAQELLAWMRKWTLRARRGGRSAYARDGQRTLKLTDAAGELEWSAPFTSRIWAELEDGGLVQKDKQGRLVLCGTVTPRRKLSAEDSIEDELASMTEYERHCAELLPLYAWLQMKRLDPPTRRQAAVEYWEADQYCRRVIADAVGGARSWVEGYREAVLARYGIKIRRHAEKAAEEASESVVTIDVKQPEKLSVQNFSADPVQATNDTSYSENSETVPGSYPYEAEEDRDNRVSKCADTGTAEPTSAHLPTLKNEAPQTHPAEAAARTPEAENLPVDEDGTQTATDAGAIEAYVVKLFGKNQSPAILRQFAALSTENNASPATVRRFLLAKVEEKIKAGYEIRSAGALLQFAREDLAGWMKLNRRELGHSARQERPAPPPAPIAPAEEITDLERYVCENPTQPDNDRTRARIATLRAQLGDAAPAPYRPPTKAEELAELEAQLQQFKNERGIDGATDPWVKFTQTRIRKLRQEIGTAANGAAG